MPCEQASPVAQQTHTAHTNTRIQKLPERSGGGSTEGGWAERGGREWLLICVVGVCVEGRRGIHPSIHPSMRYVSP